MKIHSHFEARLPYMPGSDGRVTTSAAARDIAGIQDAIMRLKESVDVVVVGFHWGLTVEPVTLADYESQLGRAAIDAGADLVLGHHQHILKAIEVYKGRFIFHGLGNFVFDLLRRDRRDIVQRSDWAPWGVPSC